MVLEIAVDRNKVIGGFSLVIGIFFPQDLIRLYPLRHFLPKYPGSVQFLQEQNIRVHPCPGIGLERIVRQTDGSQQVAPLGDIFPGTCVFLVHGSAAAPVGCDKSDHPAGAHLINGLCDKIIMDKKFLPVITPVYELIASKGDIPYRHVKKAVRELGLFKSADGNVCFRVKELCDPAGNAVQLHAVHLQVIHALRHKPQEVPDPAGRLQHISFL